MTLPLLDFSTTEKPAQVQENLCAYYRLFGPLPGMVMLDEAESFWFVGRKPGPGNIVLRTGWAVERSEEKIDQMLAQVRLHTDQIDWMVFPGDHAADLNRRLEERGCRAGGAVTGSGRT